MHRGYVKLWRKIEDSPVFKDPDLLKLWCLCLMKATHKHTYVQIDGIKEPIELHPGEFVTGRYALHSDYYPKRKKNQKSPISVWRWLRILKNMQNVNIKTYNKYSIVSIVNWDIYQSDEIDNEQQNEQQMNNRRSTDEQQMITNKNNKHNKNKTLVFKSSADFDVFWAAYPKKRNKSSAIKAWQKSNGNRPSIEEILTAIKKQSQTQDWKKDDGQFIPLPSTWLNGKRWEDEIDVTISHDDDPPYWQKYQPGDEL